MNLENNDNIKRLIELFKMKDYDLRIRKNSLMLYTFDSKIVSRFDITTVDDLKEAQDYLTGFIDALFTFNYRG